MTPSTDKQLIPSKPEPLSELELRHELVTLQDSYAEVLKANLDLRNCLYEQDELAKKYMAIVTCARIKLQRNS